MQRENTGARVLGKWLTAKTGQPVIVDNRPGASGFIAAQAVAAADPAVRQEFANSGGRSRGSTPDELRAFAKSEMAKWAAAVKTAGIQPE